MVLAKMLPLKKIIEKIKRTPRRNNTLKIKICLALRENLTNGVLLESGLNDDQRLLLDCLGAWRGVLWEGEALPPLRAQGLPVVQYDWASSSLLSSNSNSWGWPGFSTSPPFSSHSLKEPR